MKKKILIISVSLVLLVVIILCIIGFIFKGKDKDQENTLAYKIYNESKEYVKDNSSSKLFDGDTNILPYLSKEDKVLDGSSILVDKKGNIALKLFFDNTCFYKDFNDGDITQSKDKNECATYALNFRESTSMYSWNSYALSKSNDLINILKELKVKDLYQSISSENMDKEYLEDIIKNYHSEGINIYRLIGDAEWSYDISSPKKEIEEIINYNETVADDAKILGVTIDIEPHTSKRWEKASDKSKQKLFNTYVDNMIKLYEFAKEGNLEVVLCTSVWFDGYENYEKLYTSAADTYSIMNYEKEHNVENIKEELNLIEKNNKKAETIAHSSTNSEEIESYHNDSFEKLQDDHKKILDNYNYKKFRASYHYLPTINYLKNKQDFLLVYYETDDDSDLSDMTLEDSKGNKIKGTFVSLKDDKYYLFVGIKPQEEYKVSSSSHDVVSSDSIVVSEDDNGRAKINVKFEKKRSDPKIGDYVSYPSSYKNVVDGWSSESSLTGWRILSIDGETVKIVSAGTPELYEYSVDADTAIKEIEKKLKKYLKSSYGISVESLNKEMIDDYCDCDSAHIGNIEDTIINNNSNVILATKYDDKKLYLLEKTGDIYEIGNIKAKFGLRPVITLNIDQFKKTNKDNEWIISRK